jgi:peptidoglycan hydrolase-like protein with peptidoglycan-binding domain
MNLRSLIIVGASVVIAGPALAGTALSTLHPEEAYPDNAPPLLASPGPYGGFIREVQQKLHDEGFDAGPVNGDFGSKTQAALVQFQLSRTLPASGMLDEQTLSQLDVRRPPSTAS